MAAAVNPFVIALEPGAWGGALAHVLGPLSVPKVRQMPEALSR
jgi:hypothetical protein